MDTDKVIQDLNQFRADLISIWMDEMGLASTQAMRKQVKNYRVYFEEAR